MGGARRSRGRASRAAGSCTSRSRTEPASSRGAPSRDGRGGSGASSRPGRSASAPASGRSSRSPRPGRASVAHVADAVDEALRVQRERQADRARSRRTPPGPKRQRRCRNDRMTSGIWTRVQMRYAGLSMSLQYFAIGAAPGLPQPAQVRPPEAADARAGDVLGRVRLGVVQAVVRGPRQRRARAVHHREERQHVAHDRVQLHRLVRDRAVIADGRAEAAQEVQDRRAHQHAPARGAASAPARRSAPTWISTIHAKNSSSPGVGRHQGCFQGACLAMSAASRAPARRRSAPLFMRHRRARSPASRSSA